METGVLGDSYGGYRARLLEKLRANGIRDLAVLRAFAEVPRHLFVPEAFRRNAYEDVALPIGSGQTISQPTTHAVYLEALELKGDERVLEIGTGSGYQAALLSFLAQQVVSVERVPWLAQHAQAALKAARCSGVTVVVGDGTLGWRPMAPYDAILVSAATTRIPPPLFEQLDRGGHLIAPIKSGEQQEIRRYRKTGRVISEETLGPAQFVELKGRYGVSDE